MAIFKELFSGVKELGSEGVKTIVLWAREARGMWIQEEIVNAIVLYLLVTPPTSIYLPLPP
ncbi:hypothetical protein [Marseilla massiliensis]|uniref:hypothetical protein n=1 Tax=Marseilla massiliensis TaxID=1841864 RepID=UPI0030C8AF70